MKRLNSTPFYIDDDINVEILFQDSNLIHSHKWVDYVDVDKLGYVDIYLHNEYEEPCTLGDLKSAIEPEEIDLPVRLIFGSTVNHLKSFRLEVDDNGEDILIISGGIEK